MKNSILVNGVEAINSVFAYEATLGIERSTARLTFKTNLGTACPVDLDDRIEIWHDTKKLFTGLVNARPPADGLATTVWVVDCGDYRSELENETFDDVTFPPNTSLNDALKSLIERVAGNTVILSEIDDMIECPLAFQTQTIYQAVLTCLALVEDKVVWKVNYNSGTIEHSFTLAHQTNIGEVKTFVKTDNGRLTTDESVIKNCVRVVSDCIIPKYADIQYFDYMFDDAPGSTLYQNRLDVPLARLPENPAVYMIVGKPTGLHEDYINASRLLWMDIENKDTGLTGFDPTSFFTGKIPTFDPGAGYTLPTSQLVTQSGQSQDDSLQLMGVLDIQMAKYLIPDATIYFTKATESATYGSVHLPTKKWIRDKIALINKMVKMNLDPDSILGWEIHIKAKQREVVEIFNPSTVWGARRKLAPMKIFNTTSKQTLQAFADSYLVMVSSALDAGVLEFDVEHGDKLGDSLYPEPGDLLDFKSLLHGTFTDAKANSVVYSFLEGSGKTHCKVDVSRKNNRADIAAYVVSRLEKLAKHEQAQDKQIAGGLAKTSSVDITLEGSSSGTLVDNSKVTLFNELAVKEMRWA